MPELHYPDGPWTRTIGRTELFDPTYVPTVIIDADKQFFISGEGSSKLNKVTFILKENVFSFNVSKNIKIMIFLEIINNSQNFKLNLIKKKKNIKF